VRRPRYEAFGSRSADVVHRVAAIGESFHAGRFAETLERLRART